METKISDWRENISETAGATLKIQDGEEKTFVFLNEGELKTSADYGDSIVFLVDHEGEQKNFYVRATNFDFLNQIKLLGKLTGLPVKVSRAGSKRSDTRYTIEKFQ